MIKLKYYLFNNEIMSEKGITKIKPAEDFYGEKKSKLGDDERKKLLKEFSEYIEEDSGLDFTVRGGKIDVNNIGGFSDGTYRLKTYNIEPIDKKHGLYSLKLNFKLEKGGMVSYAHKINLTFHYENGNEMVIKYRGNFYRINIGDKVLEKRYRRGGKVIIEEVGKKIPIHIDKLKLILEFKTD